MTLAQAKNPYTWNKVLSLIQTSFAYMENRIDPPSSMHRLTVEAILKHSETGEIWVNELQNSPISCMFLTPKAHALYLGKLTVSEAYRGQGLAHQLVDCAQARCLALGFTTLELQTRVELVENHHAFAKMGFRKTGESAHDGYDRPTNITMQKELK